MRASFKNPASIGWSQSEVFVDARASSRRSDIYWKSAACMKSTLHRPPVQQRRNTYWWCQRWKFCRKKNDSLISVNSACNRVPFSGYVGHHLVRINIIFVWNSTLWVQDRCLWHKDWLPTYFSSGVFVDLVFSSVLPVNKSCLLQTPILHRSQNSR